MPWKRRFAALAVAAVAASAAIAGQAAGAAAAPPAELDRIGSFDAPVHVAAPPDDTRRLFVVEQRGKVRVMVDGDKRSKPFLDIRDEVNFGGERGLLSIAFAPDYEDSRKLYAYYTGSGGDIFIAELKRKQTSRNLVDSGTRRTVLRVPHPTFANHNGGQLQFGPDGRLYAGLGDGGSADDPFDNGQDRGTLLGKLLRINPEKDGDDPYSVPPSNPYVGRSGRNEIYARGLRNPFRFAFDRETGDIAIGDVGQSAREEIDFEDRGEARGANFGWSCFEGTLRKKSCQAPGHDQPVLEQTHSDGFCAITGGFVVRDPRLSGLLGRYLYGDFCESELRSARLRASGATGDEPIGLFVDRLSSFGEDARGRVYAASLGGGVYRLDPP